MNIFRLPSGAGCFGGGAALTHITQAEHSADHTGIDDPAQCGLRRQIRRTIWLEAISVAVIGLILGALLGSVNLYYLLQIVQHDVIGMRLDYQFPFVTVLELIPVMLGAAFVAALLPSESAVRIPLVQALEYE